MRAPNESQAQVLGEVFRRFLDSAEHVARGYVAAAGSAALDKAQHHRVAMAAEECGAFRNLRRLVAQEVPRYRPTGDEQVLTRRGALRSHDPEVMAGRELATFLRRAGAYRSLLRGEPLDAESLARTFLEDAARAKVRVRHLVPIDGLYLAEGVQIDFGAGRLVRLSSEEWEAFFESDFGPTSGALALSNVGVLEMFQEDQDRHRGLLISFAPLGMRVARIAEPWITYLCLYGPRAVRPCGLYSKPETLLRDRAVDVVHLLDPSAEERYCDDEQTVPDLVPIYELEVRGDAAKKLHAFLVEMESGRKRAEAKGPRLETALHWFRRSAAYLYDDVERASFLPREAYEDFIADTFTALEAVLLKQGEGKKGPRISERGAALLGEPNAAAHFSEAYELRNRIVHGDERPQGPELARSAEFVSSAVRRILIAELRAAARAGSRVQGTRQDE